MTRRWAPGPAFGVRLRPRNPPVARGTAFGVRFGAFGVRESDTEINSRVAVSPSLCPLKQSWGLEHK